MRFAAPRSRPSARGRSMSDPARALGFHFEDGYAPVQPPRWTQPWSSNAVRAATAIGTLLVGFLLTTGMTAGRQAAIEQGARKSELIALIGAREERAAALGAQ